MRSITLETGGPQMGWNRNKLTPDMTHTQCAHEKEQRRATKIAKL